MKFKFLTKGLLIFTLFTIALTSCEKTEPAPSNKIEGSWAMESFIAKDESQQEIDYFSLISAFYPCVKEGRITFKDGTYTTSLPSTCVDADGASLQLFPSAKSGSYTISDSGAFSIDDDGDLIEGTYVFETDNKFVFTAKDGTDDVKIAFVKK